MALDTQSDVAAFLERSRGVHDRMVSIMYRAWTREPKVDIGVLANDPELTFHLDHSEAIGTYLEQR